MISENRFDQLFSASVIGGPYEKFESIPPMLNRYLACGNSPFISFYYAFDVMLNKKILLFQRFFYIKHIYFKQTAPLPFQDVKAVASKVTSALMNAAK